MRTKIIVVVSVVVLMAGGVIAARNMGRLTSYKLNASQQANAREDVQPNQRLKWYAEKSKAKGESEIILDAPFIDYPGNSASTHIDQAIASFSTVIAEPIKEEVVADDIGNILTWYKFNIIESLSEKNPYDCSGCPAPPNDLLPLKENQFAMAKYGGSVTIDGVKLTMVDPTFPQLKLKQQYLLFISRAPSGIATIGVGPNGVFEVEPNGSLTPINRNPHSIKDDVKKLDKSLDKFKDHARHVSQ